MPVARAWVFALYVATHAAGATLTPERPNLPDEKTCKRPSSSTPNAVGQSLLQTKSSVGRASSVSNESENEDEEHEGLPADQLNSNELHQPVIVHQLNLIWKFIIYAGMFVSLTVLVALIHMQCPIKYFLDLNGLNLQMVVALEILMICHCGCVWFVATHGRASHWIPALRNVVEAWLLLLVYTARPTMLFEYLERSQEARSERAGNDTARTDESILVASASSPDVASISSPDAAVHLARLQTCWQRLAIPLMIRVMTEVALAVLDSCFSYKASFMVGITCSGASLALLGIAIGVGLHGTYGLQGLLDQKFGLDTMLVFMQLGLSLLFVLAHVQGLILMGLGSALVLAPSLYIVETVIMIMIYTFLASSDPIALIASYSAHHQDHTSLKLKILKTLKPYAVQPRISSDEKPIDLKRHKRFARPQSPHELKEEERAMLMEGKLEARNHWRWVLLDIFSSRVRSKFLSVIIVAMWMDMAIDTFADMPADVAKKFPGSDFAHGAILAVSQLAVAFVTWLLCGITLIGNNVFMSHRWLFLAFVKLSYVTMNCFHFFLAPPLHAGGKEPSPTDLWMECFLGLSGVLGLGIIVSLFCTDSTEFLWFRTEVKSMEYTLRMLEAPPGHCSGKKHCELSKSLFRNMDDYPQLLLIGVVAAVPVVLAVSIVVMFGGQEVLRHARIAQTYVRVVNGDESMVGSAVLHLMDINHDLELSPYEAGLTDTSLMAAHDLETAVVDLWRDTDESGDGKLSESELNAFLMGMYKSKALLDCWKHPDSMLGGEMLLATLDKDRNGAIDNGELSERDLNRVLTAVAPDEKGYLIPLVADFWIAADIDQDGKLDMDELGMFLDTMKKNYNQFKNGMSEVVVLLLRAGMDLHLHRKLQQGTVSKSPGANDSGAESQTPTSPRKSTQGASGTATSRLPIMSDIATFLLSIFARSVKSARGAYAMLLAAVRSLGSKLEAPLVSLRGEILGLPPPPDPRLGKRPVAGLAQTSEVPLWSEAQNLRAEVQDLSVELWVEVLSDVIETMEGQLHELTRRGSAVLEALEDSPEISAQRLVTKLDRDPFDGKLDSEELGLHSALAIVHPEMASHADDLFSFCVRLFNKGDKVAALSVEGITSLLRYSEALLSEHFGDVDGDGDTNEKDLHMLVHAAIYRMSPWRPDSEELVSNSTSHVAAEAVNDTASQNPRGSEQHATSASRKAALAQHGFRREKLRRADFPLRKMPQPARRMSLEQLQEESGEPSEFFNTDIQAILSAYAMPAARALANFNLDRIETFLYVAALSAFGFGLLMIYAPFRGYRRVFETMQSGSKDYKGHKSIKDLEMRADFATFFPGLLFSTVLSGMAVIFVLVFAFLNLVTSDALWQQLWEARSMLMWLGVTLLIQLVIMRRLILDKYCQEGGDIIHPRVFSCVYVMFVVINFALGALSAVFRILCMLPILFFQLHSLDDCSLDEDFVPFDIGYASFLTLTRMDYRAANPIKRAFVNAINPSINRKYAPKKTDAVRLTPGSDEMRHRKAITRWWLASVLAMNQHLLPHRKHRLRNSSE